MKRKRILGSVAIIGLLAFGSTALAQYVYQPTDVAGAGLSYIRPDNLIWYSLNGYVTNGPVQPGVNGSGIPFQVWNNDTWEPYGGVLGDRGCGASARGGDEPGGTVRQCGGGV